MRINPVSLRMANASPYLLYLKKKGEAAVLSTASLVSGSYYLLMWRAILVA